MLHSFPQNPKLSVTLNRVKQDPQIQLVFKETWSFCNDWKRSFFTWQKLQTWKFSQRVLKSMDPIPLCPLWTDFVQKGNQDIPTKQKLSSWNIRVWVTLALTSHVQWRHHAFVVVIVDLWRYYKSVFFRYIYLFHSVGIDKCVIKSGQRKIRRHLTRVLQVPSFWVLNILQNFLKEY